MPTTKCKAPTDTLTSRPKRACLCREVHTDHEAHGQRGDDRNSKSRTSVGDVPEAEHPKHDGSHAQAVCQGQETTWTRPRAVALLRSHTNTRSARRGENSGAGQFSRPRTARKGVCSPRERHAGRDGPTAGDKSSANNRREEQCQQQARRAVPTAGEKNSANSRREENQRAARGKAADVQQVQYQLKRVEAVTTIPTNDFNVETVEYKNLSFTVQKDTELIHAIFQDESVDKDIEPSYSCDADLDDELIGKELSSPETSLSLS